MAKKQPTTVNEREVDGAVVNPRDLKFPFDQYGFTTLLRKEGVRSIGRIKGDPAKLEVFMNTLRVLAQHAETKLEDHKKRIEMDAAAAENRRKADEARRKADQKRELTRLESMAVEAAAAVEAQKGLIAGDADDE